MAASSFSRRRASATISASMISSASTSPTRENGNEYDPPWRYSKMRFRLFFFVLFVFYLKSPDVISTVVLEDTSYEWVMHW